MRLKTYISLIILISGFQPRVISQVNWLLTDIDEGIKPYSVYHDSQGMNYCSSDNGLLKSQDGINWIATSFDGIISACFVDSLNRIYVKSIYDLFISEDQGQTWDTIHTDVNLSHCIITTNQNILLGGFNGIYVSQDNGSNWSHVLELSNASIVYDIAVNSDGVLFAVCENYSPTDEDPGGIYKSIDNGITWEHIGLDYYYIVGISINSNNELFVIASGNYNTGDYGVFKSSDDGDSWLQVFDAGQPLTIDINNYDEVVVGCSEFWGGGLHISSDNGNTWSDITTNLPNRNINEACFLVDNRLFSINIINNNTSSLFVSEQTVGLNKNRIYDKSSVQVVYKDYTNSIVIVSKTIINKVKIFSINGNCVLNYCVLPAGKIVNIKVPEINRGIYIINIIDEKNNIHTKKINLN